MYILVARDSRGQVVGSAPVTGQPMTVGRAAGNALVLPSTAVSRRHASAYLTQDGGVVITDEGSANGVKVDGLLIGGPTLIDATNRVDISEFVLRLEPIQPDASQAQVVAPAGPIPEPDDDEAEENYTVLEAHVDLAALLAGTLQLKGRGGPYDGTVFSVDKPLLTVGRNDDNDVVLDDPSVSRRHAQLRLSVAGDRLTVLDLRSSNGTFVAGERVKRAECGVDQVLRFGDLAFAVQREQRKQGAKQRNRASGRRRLLIAGGVVLALLVAVGVVAYINRPTPPPPRRVTPEERLRLLQADVQRHVDEGKRRLTLKEWTAAVTAFDQALARDPLNSVCQKQRARALEELQNEKTYEKGQQFYSLGNPENLTKAREVFLKIPNSSVYFRDVRYKVKTINTRLADGFRIEGVSRCKARYWDHCHRNLCRFFQLIPSDRAVPGEGSLRRMLQGVEARLKRRRRKDFEPCLAPRFLRPAEEQAGESPDARLAEKYRQPSIRAVLLLYVQGRIDSAIKNLTRLRKDRKMRPFETTLREIDRQLLIIRGKYQEGYTAFRDRSAVLAQKHWDLVLAADRALLPAGLESFYRREIVRSLGDLYFELGEEQFKLGRFREAHASWSRGLRAAPKHDRVLNGILQLEKQAEKLVRDGKQLAAAGSVADARAKLELARDITAEDRPIHEQAIQALKGL